MLPTRNPGLRFFAQWRPEINLLATLQTCLAKCVPWFEQKQLRFVGGKHVNSIDGEVRSIFKREVDHDIDRNQHIALLQLSRQVTHRFEGQVYD